MSSSNDELPKRIEYYKSDAARRYLLALGRFFDALPRVEQALVGLLLSLSGLQREIGLAIFGDIRIDSAISTINRVLEARRTLYDNDPAVETLAREQFAYVSQQVGIINGIRNKVAHHWTIWLGTKMSHVTNVFRARTSDSMWMLAISATDLENMAHDLNVAALLLGDISGQQYGSSALERYRLLRARYPWTYKSPLQGDPSESRPNKTRKRARPPRPSRA